MAPSPVESPSYIDSSIRSFLVNLAGKSTEPAGGAALALAAASAAALVSLTCHAGISALARGGGEADDTRALEACQFGGQALSERIQHLIDEDVVAYHEVTRALRLPHSTTEAGRARKEALDRALRGAIEVPLEVASAGLEILELVLDVEPTVHPPAFGDLAAAAHLAEAAVKGSLRNALLNAAALADEAFSAEARARIDVLDARLKRLAGMILAAFESPGAVE